MSTLNVSNVDYTRTQACVTGRVGGGLTLAYGLIAYAAFFVTILYAIGFLANVGVPKSVNGLSRAAAESSAAALPAMSSTEMGTALLINAALLTLFVVQHTIMARPAFKRWWTQFVPPAAERSTFVLAASACLGLLFWQWQPLPQIIWRIEGLPAFVLTAISMIGWAVVFIASFTISHLDLFGVRQAWLRFRNQPYTAVGFRLRGLYRLVRHPLMVGFLIAFWATPTMTAGHLFFAIMTTAYILFGTWIEERDLRAAHGAEYEQYRRSVRAFVPLPKRRAAAGLGTAALLFFLGKGVFWLALGAGGCAALSN